MIRALPWTKSHLPKRILVFRFHALGDLVITLPYLRGLKQLHPSIVLDVVCTDEYEELLCATGLFDRVIPLRYHRKAKRLAWSALCAIPALRKAKYDALLDLQNNRISRLIRSGLGRIPYAAFDRFSPISAGIRTQKTIEALGLGEIVPDFTRQPVSDQISQRLIDLGWQPGEKLIVLNPAGVFASRNWPLENYVSFARLWLEHYPESRFLFLGLDALTAKVAAIKQHLAERVIDFTGQTSVREAFELVQQVDFMLSEDSGLMHMAWGSGVPTLALFGSSRADWSAPGGEHTTCLHSGDLACGACMEPLCQWGDNRCLTRYSANLVMDAAMKLIPEKI